MPGDHQREQVPSPALKFWVACGRYWSGGSRECVVGWKGRTARLGSDGHGDVYAYAYWHAHSHCNTYCDAYRYAKPYTLPHPHTDSHTN